MLKTLSVRLRRHDVWFKMDEGLTLPGVGHTSENSTKLRTARSCQILHIPANQASASNRGAGLSANTYVRSGAGLVRQDVQHVLQLHTRAVARGDSGLFEPSVCRVLEVVQDNCLEVVDNGSLSGVHILRAVAVWRVVVAYIEGREAGLVSQ